MTPPLDAGGGLAWRPLLEGMAASVAAAVGAVAGTEAGRERLTVGAGGDRTAIVDRVAEDAVIGACDRLHAAGMRFLLRSEELGERRYGADLPVLLVDPVDGSGNAMAGIPYYSTSLAVLKGETLGDVVAGVVRNLAGPGTFSAVRGAGAERDGQALRPLAVGLSDSGGIPILIIEAHRQLGARSATQVRLGRLLERAGRVRMLGSSALSLCQVASGAASALVAPDGMRAWDAAAALCVLGEVGAVVTDLGGNPVTGDAAGFGWRTPLVASLDAGVHARVLELLAEGQPTE